MTLLLMPAIGVLCFYLSGVLLGAQKGDIVAIRTPWALSSEIVWEKTHLLAYRLFKFLGFIAFLSPLARSYAVPVFFATLVVVMAGLVLYSYVAHRDIRLITRAVSQLSRMYKAKTI